LGTGGALGGPAHPGVNSGGKTSNLGAAPHDWGFAKKHAVVDTQIKCVLRRQEGSRQGCTHAHTCVVNTLSELLERK